MLGLSGARKGCCAAGQTLKVGIEDQLRAKFPQLKGISTEASAARFQ